MELLKDCFVAKCEWSDSELEEMGMCGDGDTDDSAINNETNEWMDLSVPFGSASCSTDSSNAECTLYRRMIGSHMGRKMSDTDGRLFQ